MQSVKPFLQTSDVSWRWISAGLTSTSSSPTQFAWVSIVTTHPQNSRPTIWVEPKRNEWILFLPEAQQLFSSGTPKLCAEAKLRRWSVPRSFWRPSKAARKGIKDSSWKPLQEIDCWGGNWIRIILYSLVTLSSQMKEVTRWPLVDCSQMQSCVFWEQTRN